MKIGVIMGFFGERRRNVINDCSISITGNNVTFDGYSLSQDCIKGSGIAKTIIMNAKPFSRANITGSVDVDFVISKSEQVIEITADDNLISFIDISYSEDSIFISYKDGANFSTCQPIKVNITCPVLEVIESTGSSDVTVSNLDQDKLCISVDGSAYISLNGHAEHAIFSIKGSGAIKAKKLEVNTLKVSISGSGDVKVTAKKSAHIRVSGSGSVKVYGNPVEKSSECNGSGEIKFK